MHAAVMHWLHGLRSRYPEIFTGRRVLEAGAMDINGSPRVLFEDCLYVGLDARPGPGVDVVGMVDEFEPEIPFDTVISTEMLEHDPRWCESLAAMVAALAPGGALLLTWAGPGRAAHGVGGGGVGSEYYRNLTMADVVSRVTAAAWFRTIEVVDRGEDVYALFLGKAEG